MMSPAMQAFYQAMQAKPEAIEQLAHYAHDPDLLVKAVVKLGELNGHILDPGEVQSAVANMGGSPDGAVDLQDEDLDNVSAGFFWESFIRPVYTDVGQVTNDVWHDVEGAVHGVVKDVEGAVRGVVNDVGKTLDPLNVLGLR